MTETGSAEGPVPSSSPSHAASSSSSRRLEKTVACLPVVVGSVAFWLGKKADEYQTHQWTLYLRGPNHEDLSLVISKVVFQLHASFAQPVRELTEPPYEVTERGWGEFEAQIRIHWRDPAENFTTLVHGIKLYPPGMPVNSVPTDMETPVVAESYDEVVFTDPTESFFMQLHHLSKAPTLTNTHTGSNSAALESPSMVYSQEKHFGQFADTDDFQALLEAQKFLRQEIMAAKERYLAVEKDLKQTEEGIRRIQDQPPASSATSTATAMRKNNAAAGRSAAASSKVGAAPPASGPTSSSVRPTTTTTTSSSSSSSLVVVASAASGGPQHPPSTAASAPVAAAVTPSAANRAGPVASKKPKTSHGPTAPASQPPPVVKAPAPAAPPASSIMPKPS